MSDMVYLYGFVPPATPEPPKRVTGIADASVRLLDLGDAHAVVSDVPAALYAPAVVEAGGAYAVDNRTAVRGGEVAGKGHLARAVLEASAFQTLDVLRAMEADSGVTLKALRVDGGMAANDWIAQDLADILDLVKNQKAQAFPSGETLIHEVGHYFGLSDEELP